MSSSAESKLRIKQGKGRTTKSTTRARTPGGISWERAKEEKSSSALDSRSDDLGEPGGPVSCIGPHLKGKHAEDNVLVWVSVTTCGGYDDSDAQPFPLLLSARIVAVGGGGDVDGVDVIVVVVVAVVVVGVVGVALLVRRAA